MIQHLLQEAVKGCFAPVRAVFVGREAIVGFLGDVESLVQRELRSVVEAGEEGPSLSRGIVVPTLLTEHRPNSGAPVVEVPYPTLAALFGRTYSPPDSEFPPEPGFAVAGALHEANGGFLILPAQAILKNDALYEQLKACLLSSKFIVPEANPSYYRGTAEELLFPPIPIDLKVVLIASPTLYQELHEADPEFSQLFKVQARFEPTLTLGEAMVTYPSFLASLTRDRNLPPLTADAVAALVFHGGRLAESQTKVTAQLGLIAEVTTEAGYRALQRGHHLDRRRRGQGGALAGSAPARQPLPATKSTSSSPTGRSASTSPVRSSARSTRSASSATARSPSASLAASPTSSTRASKARLTSRARSR